MAVLLKYHQDLEHGGRQKVCTICGKTATKLYEHMQTAHSVVNNFQCDRCDYKCKTKNRLTIHMKNHIDPEDRKYKCEICGKGFLSTQKLKEHILTHAKIKPYKCELCNQAFSNYSGHRQHMMRKVCV